ncbi:biotin--[acetyl-CoA-carboxylase] ligase [Alicyclobacillus dauci]|uniref:Bifunctional ligase/repressor BirA n=1 Tax=Alicyclobacillus dauci TaxID=1475485 RepID=A0ABY6YYT6_9BACL|nr:biotin--[acetyl-CoA-carboxylase] ligase [Alicyclobacillus dauci]WAH35141.1 biotin--[acetyl-CoA-carboxylase] ligase [Alicyclobacillus dauci]
MTERHDGNQIQNDILDMFLHSESEAVSGEQLSQQLGLSRTAVWKQIKQLESYGFQFEASPRIGYRLTFAPDELMEPLVKMHVANESTLGHTVLWAPDRESTNQTATALARDGSPHGIVVTARQQSGGKGRQGRIWTSPSGGMWFSVLVREPCALSQAADLTLLASVAVHRALVSEGVQAQIKWPNDILVHGKKVCGILAQMRTDGETVEYAVIGIGINANFSAELFPPEMREYATTILDTLGRPVFRPRVLGHIINELSTIYRALEQGVGGFRTVREEWKANAHTLGRKIQVRMGNTVIHGVAEDVDDNGVLILCDDSGEKHHIHSGEVLFSAAEQV